MRQSVPGDFGLSQVFSGWETDECPKSSPDRRQRTASFSGFFRIFPDFFTLPPRRGVDPNRENLRPSVPRPGLGNGMGVCGKRGTDSEPNCPHATENGVRRGACPLFKRAASAANVACAGPETSHPVTTAGLAPRSPQPASARPPPEPSRCPRRTGPSVRATPRSR